MRPESLAVVFSATSVVLLTSFVSADTSAHASLARRHMHHSKRAGGLVKRQGVCEFPTNAGLVAVTPEEENAGWALSPDQPCKPGMYCPYACPPGQLMNQWDPTATTYSYPKSQNGGLYCNEDGEIEKPFPNRPLCVAGTGTISAVNEAGGSVAICQTVLPGNEAMLIPTHVESKAVLAVPDESYWASTAAHYYINPPGVSVEEACVWGTKERPVGNWSPYVAGANTVEGDTFVKIGWNPIYIEPDVPFRDERPDWGVRIDCVGGGCNGLPCEIDPAVHDVNELSQEGAAGAGGANFCVVTVPEGSHASIVTFNAGGGTAGGGGTKTPPAKEVKEEAPVEEEVIVDLTKDVLVISSKVKAPVSSSSSSSESSSQTSSTSSKADLAKPTQKAVQKEAVTRTSNAEKVKETPWVGKKVTATIAGSKASATSSSQMKAVSVDGGDELSLLSTSESGEGSESGDSTLGQPDAKKKGTASINSGVKISSGFGLLCSVLVGATILLI